MEERLTLNSCQVIQREWEEDCLIERTPQSRCLRKSEEDRELKDAVRQLSQEDTPENRKAVAAEAADVIVITLSIIDTLGYDAERFFERIMEKNYRKYPPEQIQELVTEQGLEPLEAMEKCKEEWELSGLK